MTIEVWETAMGMRKYPGSPAEREDRNELQRLKDRNPAKIKRNEAADAVGRRMARFTTKYREYDKFAQGVEELLDVGAECQHLGDALDENSWKWTPFVRRAWRTYLSNS